MADIYAKMTAVLQVELPKKRTDFYENVMNLFVNQAIDKGITDVDKHELDVSTHEFNDLRQFIQKNLADFEAATKLTLEQDVDDPTRFRILSKQRKQDKPPKPPKVKLAQEAPAAKMFAVGEIVPNAVPPPEEPIKKKVSAASGDKILIEPDVVDPFVE